MPFSQGYDMSFRFNWDGLGITYIIIAATWTLALTIASVFLVRHRNVSFLRIRNVPLSVGGVATLHVYLVLCLIAYVFNGNFPCSTEFWIMSIYLPLGIALFHASNAQLLHVAMLQKKFAPSANTGDVAQKSKALAWKTFIKRLNASGPTKRAMTLIGIGMTLQFVSALVVFVISKKFHSGFGTVEWSDRPVNEKEASFECRKGWEWWPSILWQFAWSWIYAPYLLYKVRNIHDTHGWRMQTVCCCLAGLPASPMWLSALYVPEMHAVNRRFVPPLWFAPSIILMQGFVIFVPCYQVYKDRRLEIDTRQIIAEWEYKKKHGSTYSSESNNLGSRTSTLSSKPSAGSIRSNRNPELYTLGTLEKTLHLNPKPLLLFAALKDFSGENVSFLTHVLEWKANWTASATGKANVLRKPEPNHRPHVTEKLRRQQFNMAVRIYSSFVSIQYSDFPINISSAHLKELDLLFAEAASKISQSSASNPSAAPFFDFDVEKAPHAVTADTSIPAGLIASPESNHYNQVQGLKLNGNIDDLPVSILVPTEFGPSSFDHAEASIRELVLTNTWPKFVNGGHANSMEKAQRQESAACWTCCPSGLWSSFAKVIPRKAKPPPPSQNRDVANSSRSSSEEHKFV